jgi:hypothetical protein
MIFTDKSISMLKSLGAVSRSVFLKEGTTQLAVTPDFTLMCEVVLDDAIPNDFAIADIHQILGVMGAIDNPSIEFGEKQITITNANGWNGQFAAANPEIIPYPATMDNINNAAVVLAFDLPSETFTKMIKLAAMNDLAQVAFMDTPSGVVMKAFNKKVNDSNSITVPITKIDKPDDLCVKLPFMVSTKNLAIEADTYQVTIADVGFAQFKSLSIGRRYVMATEMASSR